MIKIMIVDDESLARDELKNLIAQDKDFHVIAEAANGTEALQKIEQLLPEVVFLDIEMPGLTGLEVASRLTQSNNPPRIVFATAFNQYAIDAFDINAVDYVLKPFKPDRILQTLKRLKEVLKTREVFRDKLIALEDTLIKKGMLQKIVGHKRNSKERVVLDPSEVFYFYAHMEEVFAYDASNEHIINNTLKELAATLNTAQFAQTHKSYIVNLGKIDKVAALFSGNFEITLKDAKHTKIPLSRRYAQRIKSILGTW